MDLYFRALDYVITYSSMHLAFIYLASDTDQNLELGSRETMILL